MILEVTIYPLGEISLSTYVAEVIDIFEDAGLTYELHPMGTVIEGDWDEVMPVIKQAHEHVFEMGAVRVSTTIKIDDRRDKKVKKEDKIESVRHKLTRR